eukprot:gene9271-biopygen4692
MCLDWVRSGQVGPGLCRFWSDRVGLTEAGRGVAVIAEPPDRLRTPPGGRRCPGVRRWPGVRRCPERAPGARGRLLQEGAWSKWTPGARGRLEQEGACSERAPAVRGLLQEGAWSKRASGVVLL